MRQSRFIYDAYPALLPRDAPQCSRAPGTASAPGSIGQTRCRSQARTAISLLMSLAGREQRRRMRDSLHSSRELVSAASLFPAIPATSAHISWGPGNSCSWTERFHQFSGSPLLGLSAISGGFLHWLALSSTVGFANFCEHDIVDLNQFDDELPRNRPGPHAQIFGVFKPGARDRGRTPRQYRLR